MIICEPRPPQAQCEQFVGEWQDKIEVANWVAEVMPWLTPEEQQEGFSTPGIYWKNNNPGYDLVIRTWLGTVVVNDGNWILRDANDQITVLTAEAFNLLWREVV